LFSGKITTPNAAETPTPIQQSTATGSIGGLAGLSGWKGSKASGGRTIRHKYARDEFVAGIRLAIDLVLKKNP
jgi:hypothetical protein